MKLICSGDVQYVNLYFTRQKKALCGDRRTPGKAKAIFELYQNSEEQKIILNILSVLPEDMYKTPKERMDVYLLKSHAETLLEGIESLLTEITSSTMLDREIRTSKDPTYKYDDSGLPLEVESSEPSVKLSSINGDFFEERLSVESTRKKESEVIPRMNIDHEIKFSQSRLHLGFEVYWEKKDISSSSSQSSIQICINWSEYAHLLGALRNIIPKM